MNLKPSPESVEAVRAAETEIEGKARNAQSDAEITEKRKEQLQEMSGFLGNMYKYRATPTHQVVKEEWQDVAHDETNGVRIQAQRSSLYTEKSKDIDMPHGADTTTRLSIRYASVNKSEALTKEFHLVELIEFHDTHNSHLRIQGELGLTGGDSNINPNSTDGDLIDNTVVEQAKEINRDILSKMS